MPWAPHLNSAPEIERLGRWQFFTADEARAMEAIVDRIIPPDPETPGGKEAGCAVFIDRQLRGGYGAIHARSLHQGRQGTGAVIAALAMSCFSVRTRPPSRSATR
ncbi:gluconate 2-dehydrogenase subunit 3 family protein [Bradyrhizobium tropiciagri]|uniref:gluconate 2-dehydrogenase subunit 3 family protein n=1 Tax=Bradyrhizobium tropiciagri TaxID=312253 RepID=UPI0024BFACB9|nr:gluconate 2-dehydrogenase subunit 3 family protein [Bradyrhizobium tropiciagri]